VKLAANGTAGMFSRSANLFREAARESHSPRILGSSVNGGLESACRRGGGVRRGEGGERKGRPGGPDDFNERQARPIAI